MKTLHIFLIISIFTLLGCNFLSINDTSSNIYHFSIDPNLKFKDSLSLEFESGELKNDKLTIGEENCICKFFNDSLLIQCRAGYMFVGGYIEILMHDDSLFIEGVKSSCTYSSKYTSIANNLTISKFPPKILDSISLYLKSTLTYGDTSSKYTDTLYLDGGLKICVREKNFSFKKQLQEMRYRQFLDLSQKAPDSIEYLDLSRLGLDSIPNELKLYVNLKSLNLGNNTIQHEQFSKIEHLTKLEELNIQHNRLEQFPKAILKLKKLKNLNFFANYIKTLPSNFHHLSSLEELQMESNDFLSFPQELKKLKHLKILYMSGNEIANYKQEISTMANIKDYN